MGTVPDHWYGIHCCDSNLRVFLDPVATFQAGPDFWRVTENAPGGRTSS